MSKFKVGDKVKVLSYGSLGTNSDIAGEVGEISFVSPHANAPYPVRVRIGHDSVYPMKDDELELVEDKPVGDCIQKLDVKVGDKVVCTEVSVPYGGVGALFTKGKEYIVKAYGTRRGVNSDTGGIITTSSSKFRKVEIGGLTLGLLDLKEGDKLKCVEVYKNLDWPMFTEGEVYKVYRRGPDLGIDSDRGGFCPSSVSKFVKVDAEPAPTINYGKWQISLDGGVPADSETILLSDGAVAFRAPVKPRKYVKSMGVVHDGHGYNISYEVLDGMPIVHTIKMEKV